MPSGYSQVLEFDKEISGSVHIVSMSSSLNMLKSIVFLLDSANEVCIHFAKECMMQMSSCAALFATHDLHLKLGLYQIQAHESGKNVCVVRLIRPSNFNIRDWSLAVSKLQSTSRQLQPIDSKRIGMLQI
jgi:hypothetical protein